MILTMKSYNWKKLNNLKRISAVLLSVVLLAGQFVIPPIARAADPQFNMYTPYVHSLTAGRDYYLLDVKNETKNTDWNFPVAADAGDTLTFYLYYHNGVNGTIATNTTLRVFLPSGSASQQTVNGYLWADNATNATANNPLSQNIQVNLSSAQTLQYISGSAKWFPNQADWRYATPTAFPNGQTENQLFGSGINLGSIEGCWEFSGTIIFRMQIGNIQPSPSPTPTQNYAFNISKTVRDMTSNQSSFAESVNASNNDRLAWQIQLTNNGNTTLNNVYVYDTLPSYISYAYGTSRLDGSYMSDGLTSGGVNIGSISPGAMRTITFESTVNSTYNGSLTLTNYAYGRADQVSERNDSATVYISQTSASSVLNISKIVRNITANSSFSVTTNANAGDHLLFLIQLTTPLNTQPITNAQVWDSLPSGLTYVSGSTRVDGGYVGEGLTTGGINLGTLYANQSRSINFEATVNSIYSGYTGSQILMNYAYTSGDGVSQRSAYAQVNVGQAITSSAPSATLTKKVANLTSPNGTDNDNNALLGDTLQYTITFYNNGPGVLNTIHVMDILPPYTTFQAADNGGSYDSSANQVAWTNGNLANSTGLSFTYRVTIQAVPNNGYVIRNTASADASNLAAISSNEVRTTVTTGVVKGAAVKAITGADSLSRNLAVSVMTSLWFLFFLYLIVEYADFWRGLRFKLAVWKIKRKENL